MTASRSPDERVADVRRLVDAARAVFERRADFAATVARTTGLSHEGVELGFESLERDATDEEIRALVASAGDAEGVHVILASNVFVAPLRALALARAASRRVTVRPSSRDPTLTLEIARAARDRGLAVVDERDVAAFDCAEVHVYGRDATTAAVRSRARPDAIVRAHGEGMGIAFVSPAADLDVAAAGVARDVVAFDQRGCLSPRIVFVEGDGDRAAAFGAALHRRLEEWEGRVPRGSLAASEVGELARWRDALAFAGWLWRGSAHAVGLAPAGAPLAVPPAGRHVQVSAVDSLRQLPERLSPIAPFLVAVGSDDPAAIAHAVPPHARRSLLGRMQRPPLDGPADRRVL